MTERDLWERPHLTSEFLFGFPFIDPFSFHFGLPFIDPFPFHFVLPFIDLPPLLPSPPAPSELGAITIIRRRYRYTVACILTDMLRKKELNIDSRVSYSLTNFNSLMLIL